jgi:hypothetical protein
MRSFEARLPDVDAGRVARAAQSPKQIPRSRAVAIVSLASDTTFMRPTAASSGW